MRRCPLLLALVAISCASHTPNPKLTAGAVAAPDVFAADTAKEILQAGGTAVDGRRSATCTWTKTAM